MTRRNPTPHTHSIPLPDAHFNVRTSGFQSKNGEQKNILVSRDRRALSDVRLLQFRPRREVLNLASLCEGGHFGVGQWKQLELTVSSKNAIDLPTSALQIPRIIKNARTVLQSCGSALRPARYIFSCQCDEPRSPPAFFIHRTHDRDSQDSDTPRLLQVDFGHKHQSNLR
jgi:hypothetical protein